MILVNLEFTEVKFVSHISCFLSAAAASTSEFTEDSSLLNS